MRIAFDLDETLGVCKTDGYQMVGFQKREGCITLLNDLREKHELVLYSVSHRTYVDKALNDGLLPFFKESYSWDEMPFAFKDIRKINADYLIDDNGEYKIMASCYAMADRYIIVPAFGSPQDISLPLLWTQIIRERLDETETDR